LGIEAKIWLGEGGFRRFCRVIVDSIAPKSGEIRTVQTDLQPIIPKSDRFLRGGQHQITAVNHFIGVTIPENALDLVRASPTQTRHVLTVVRGNTPRQLGAVRVDNPHGIASVEAS